MCEQCTTFRSVNTLLGPVPRGQWVENNDSNLMTRHLAIKRVTR